MPYIITIKQHKGDKVYIAFNSTKETWEKDIKRAIFFEDEEEAKYFIASFFLGEPPEGCQVEYTNPQPPPQPPHPDQILLNF